MSETATPDEEAQAMYYAMARFAREQLGAEGILLVIWKDERVTVSANGTGDFREAMPNIVRAVAEATGQLEANMVRAGDESTH